MIYDVIIIGGGPAGISAGIYAARQRLKTLLITKNFGGQLNKKAMAVENYPGFSRVSGLELVEKFKSHLKDTEIDIEEGKVSRVEKKENKFVVLTGEEKTFESKTVIVASGADPRPLEVPGEKEFLGKGVSYCAICDGALFKDKAVAVIGGGNSAFESAIFLSNIASKIYILEFGSQIKAFPDNQEAVDRSGKAEIITDAAMTKIEGDDFVKSITYEDKKTGKEKTLAVEGVFVEIGYQPATFFVKDLVDFNDRDEIVVDPVKFQTKTLGLFAAGDVNVGKYKQIITACAEGAIASLSAFEYIKTLQNTS